MTYQKIKVILSYLLIAILLFAVFSHIKWENDDYALPIFIALILLFILYFYSDHVKETTLCFIVKDDKVLMMYRNKKKNDVHIDKYNGLGGKVEFGETRRQAILREVREEANIQLKDYHYLGRVRFKNVGKNLTNEIMYCFVAYDFDGEISDCSEGELVWIDKSRVLSLPLWEGDQYFIMEMINHQKFRGFIEYDGEKVVRQRFKYKGKKS